jgi:hypothetical protein
VRLEIASTQGVLQITNGNLSFRESSTDLRDFLAESDDPSGKLALESRQVPLDSGGGDHPRSTPTSSTPSNAAQSWSLTAPKPACQSSWPTR